MSTTFDDLTAELVEFKSDYFYMTLSDTGRRHLDALVKVTAAACLKVHDARKTFLQMLQFYVAVGRYPAYLELVLTHPWLLARLVRLADASPLLAEFLIHNPLLFDDIVSVCQSRRLPSREEMRATLARDLQSCDGSAEAMQIVMRRFKQSRIVELLSIDVDGDISLEAVSDHLSSLADELLDATIQAVAHEMGFASPPQLAIVAYGKLGSREMSYMSDTDVVFLLDRVSEREEHELSRFASSINQWITNYTAAGILYETDFRLRPDGSSGMLVCGIDAYREYLENKAWTWEHQALVRARWCAGSANTGRAFEAVRLDILGMPRDEAKLSTDVREMRQKMFNERRFVGDGFDVKHSRGGIIDVEFIVQYLVLRHGASHTQLFEHGGNIRLLGYAAAAGLVDKQLATRCATAYRCYRIWLHQQRLRGNEDVIVGWEAVATHADAVGALWAAVFGCDSPVAS
jgi:glutamate-ammonia-ligase adenylyltransferase